MFRIQKSWPSRAVRFLTIMVLSLLPAVARSPQAHADPLAVVHGETLDVKADELKVDIEHSRAMLSGNVQAQMGDLLVQCPEVEIRYDEAPQVRWARGTGGVRAELLGIVAKAESVEVDVKKRQVHLSGGVSLTKGSGWVTAQRANIDIATRKVTLQKVEGSIPVKPPAR